MGGRDVQEGGAIYIYLELVHFVAQWKLTQRGEAAIPQFKEKGEQRNQRGGNDEQHFKKISLSCRTGTAYQVPSIMNENRPSRDGHIMRFHKTGEKTRFQG